MSNTHSLLQITYEQIDALAVDTSLLIVHPAMYQYQRQVTHRLLSLDNSVYLHLGSDSSDLQGLLGSLSAVLREQLDLELGKLSKSPEKAAGEVAKTINGFKRFMLVIEGYDSVEDASVHAFLLTLVNALEKNHHIALLSRQIPMPLLPRGDNTDRCVMLPNLPERLFVDYAHPPLDKDILEVRALGSTQALINGRPLLQWDGVLPKCLFYYMIDRAMTTRNDIFDTFWPNLEKREATNVFHVTKRKVSEILGQDLTTYAAGFYRIADEIGLHYDVVAFQEAAQNAEVADDDDEAIRLFQEAIRLYRGPFLSTLDQPWIQERREELQQVYTDALTGLARIREKMGDDVEALGLYLRAAANIPHREDLARTIMEIYSRLRQPERALEVFERLENDLKTRLNMKPDPETVKLATQIRKQL